MDLTAFFASASAPPPALPNAARDEPKLSNPIVQPPIKSKIKVKANTQPTKSVKVIKIAKVARVAIAKVKNSPAKPAKHVKKPVLPGGIGDLDEDPIDPDIDADDNLDHEFDEVPEDDSQWGGDGEDIHENESEGGDDHACIEDEDLDDESGMVACDVDLDTSYSRIGAWKRRDKSTLPCPDLVGPPLEPDDDSHII